VKPADEPETGGSSPAKDEAKRRQRRRISLRVLGYRLGKLTFLGVIAALTTATGFASYANIREHGMTGATLALNGTRLTKLAEEKP
jgi:hypothetical protein